MEGLLSTGPTLASLFVKTITKWAISQLVHQSSVSSVSSVILLVLFFVEFCYFTELTKLTELPNILPPLLFKMNFCFFK